MSESAVPLALSRITVATTLHQHVKTNLSHDGLGKCTNMDFSQRFQTQKYVFVILIRFLAVSWIQGCFHWLSSPFLFNLSLFPKRLIHCYLEKVTKPDLNHMKYFKMCCISKFHDMQCKALIFLVSRLNIASALESVKGLFCTNVQFLSAL